MLKRVKRDDTNLIKTLNDELDKLKEFYYKVYWDDDKKYLGNIASQLRILVIRKKRNHALLLDFLDKYKDKFDITIEYVLPPNHPDHGKKVTLNQYLDHVIVKAIRTQSGELVSLNYRQLIEKYSQQLGGAHQDPAIEEDIQAIENTVIPFLGIDASFLFKTVTNRVLDIGYHCLKKIKSNEKSD